MFEAVLDYFKGLFIDLSEAAASENGTALIFTAVARWIFVILAVFILLRAIIVLSVMDS